MSAKSSSGIAGSSRLSPVSWIESLSPWPEDGFGLERIRELLRLLGEPQRRFPSIHVVGSNGKGTVTRTIEETLARESFATGGYYSPHVRGWSERIRVGGREADFDRAVERVRVEAEAIGATQFEALTAAAFAEFADAEIDVAGVEAGLGGRFDATNVVDAPVVVLTNVALEHTEVLGDTREAIAREKLAVVRPGATVILGEPEWEGLARGSGAARIVSTTGGNAALGAAACEAFLGRSVEPAEVLLPGRLEQRGDELWDGAHTPEALRYVIPQLPPIRAVVASVLRDKDVDEMLRLLAGISSVLLATSSSNSRALSAQDLARLAEPYFARVEAIPDPTAARERARDVPGDGLVLVTGSLYLLADLSSSD
jgi:dihydrofolate synthase / folylpolyglutamate synthase